MNIPKNAITVLIHKEIDLDQPSDQAIGREQQDSISASRTSDAQASHSGVTISS
jgi:hypothetical protein